MQRFCGLSPLGVETTNKTKDIILVSQSSCLCCGDALGVVYLLHEIKNESIASVETWIEQK